MTRNSQLLVLTALLMVAGASVARAQCDARCHFARGQSAYETGDYNTAISEWTQAYSQDPRPLLQYNLGSAYERLGQLQQAAAAYQNYVNSAETDPDRMANARARIAAIQGRIQSTAVRLHGGPEGAQIIVDGQDRGRLPHPDPLSVQPGQHQLVVRLAGYGDFALDTALSVGQVLDVNVTMRAGTSGTTALTGGGGISLVGLIIGGGGLVVSAVGLVIGIIGFSGAGSAANDAQASDARTLGLVADLMIWPGLGVAALGAVLMFVLPGDLGGSHAQLVPLLGPGLAGAGLLGSF